MTRSFLSDLLAAILDRGRDLLRSDVIHEASINHERSVDELCDELLSRRGEASGVAIARNILDQYAELNEADRLAFFELLAEKFGPNHEKVGQAIKDWQGKRDEAALHFASEPRRQELFRRLNHTPRGTANLVRMREQLLECLSARPALRIVDRDFTHLFASWFNRGFLVLKPIDWTTPINILERIVQYEAVHAIENWDDLRNRLKPIDRRCFAFFHPQLVDEPLIFVEIALTMDVPSAIAPLLHLVRTPIRPENATTAVFYSISNTQKGLAGISFGNFLIKQVVAELQSELPHLETFVTLSPLPGFAAWLRKERIAARIEPTELAKLTTLDCPQWHQDPSSRLLLRDVLLRLGARYLMDARNPGGRPLDPVARFHLGNGARLERLNFLADTSVRGLEQSHGLMVNYLYALHEIERNHEAFAENGTVVASPAVYEQGRIDTDSRKLVSAH